MKQYNGFKNYQTWNVSLWINNDESLYNLAKESQSYEDFIETLREVDLIETPDLVAFNDSGLDIEVLNKLLLDLKN